MRFLANENFPGDAVKALRAQGHHVIWISEESPGITDAQVLVRAQQEDLLLITFDKEFWSPGFPFWTTCNMWDYLVSYLNPVACFCCSTGSDRNRG